MPADIATRKKAAAKIQTALDRVYSVAGEFPEKIDPSDLRRAELTNDLLARISGLEFILSALRETVEEAAKLAD